jgi:hypothetical protein
MIKLSYMSSEQLLNTETVQDHNEVRKKNIPTRVDINHLVAKLREKEKSQKNGNLLFFGTIGLILLTSGIITTL